MALQPLITTSPDGLAFLGAWSLHLLPAVALAIAAAGYGLAAQRARRSGHGLPGRAALFFVLGLLALALAWLGPPATYGDMSLSMRMTRLLLLVTVAPPLLVLGRPLRVAALALPAPPGGTSGRSRGALAWLTHPLVALLATNGVLVLWHVPPVHDAALTHAPLGALAQATLLVTALVYWWTLIDPPPWQRPLPRVLTLGSLFLTSLFVVGLGGILAVLPHAVYAFDPDAPRLWGLQPLHDQQLAGSILWAGGGFIYMVIIFGMIVRTLGWDMGDADGADRPGATASQSRTG